MGAKVMPLAMACCSSDEPVIVELDTRRMSADYLAGLRAILEKHKGTVPVNVHMVVDESLCLLQLGPRWTVQPGPVFENDLNKWTHGGM